MAAGKTASISTFVKGIKVLAGEIHAHFRQIGLENIYAMCRLSDKLFVRFDYFPKQTLKRFPSMEAYYCACVLHTFHSVGLLKQEGFRLHDAVKALGITKSQFNFIWGYSLTA